MRRVDLGSGVAAAVTDRSGGTSTGPYAGRNLATHVGDDPGAVAANRAATARAIGLDPGRVVWMAQVHGADVTVLAAPCPQAVPAADALVATTQELALAVLVADCSLVLLADPTAGVVAAVHAGRRGVAGAVVVRAVETMAACGAEPDRVRGYVGPTICGGCYEVDAATQAKVAARAPGSACTTRAGAPGLDLRAGIRRHLAAAGVGTVTVDPACPAEDPSYFSYRRDRGRTGRFAGYVWLSG